MRCGLTALLTACSGGGSTKPQSNTPSSIQLSQSGSIALASGATTAISATVMAADGRVLTGVALTWTTSDVNVATVSGGLVTAIHVGTATIAATASGVTSPGVIVNVAPGVATQMAVRTQPSGAAVAAAFIVQPAVELRDAAGNLATSANVAVSVAVGSGGGALAGTTTVNAVAGVATFANLSLVGTVGARTLTFSSGTLAAVTSQSFTLSAGQPAALGLRTQPSGAAVGALITSQPVVEVRDAGGNLVNSATSLVTAALSSGGGTLAGNSTVLAVAGVATFTDLVLTGTAGQRTLNFTAVGVAPVQSASFTLAPGAAAQMALTTQPVGGAVGAPLVTTPVIELRDISGNVATTSNIAVTAVASFGGGSVSGGTVNAVAGVASFSNLSISGPVGDRELTFSANAVQPVTSTRFTLVAILYGTPAQKVQILDVNASALPASSTGSPPTFTSRAASRATVDGQGRITGRAEGQTWVVSTAGVNADSVLVIVTRSTGGPVLRTSLTTTSARAGDATTVDLILDPRSTPVGAVSVFVAAYFEDDNQYGGTVASLPVNGVQVVMNQPTLSLYRFSIAAVNGINAPITFGRLQFTAGPQGAVLYVNVTILDGFGPDGTDLLPRITSTSYPVIFK